MEEKKGIIKSGLIRYYKAEHNKVKISPLRDDYAAPLVDFYLQPEMMAIDIQHRRIDERPSKTPVQSYQQLFFQDQETPIRNIYLTADSGIGKTEFSKRLSLVWSHAHDPQESWNNKFSEDDVSVMKKYDFLFLILMREVDRSFCDVDKIVLEFVKSHLLTGYDDKTLTDLCHSILFDNACLIVLDGLDEWSHPLTCSRKRTVHDAPHIKHCPKHTVLITSRPWKFDFAQVPAQKIDCHIQIEEMNLELSNNLVKNAVVILNSVTDTKKDHTDFLTTVVSSNLSEIRFIPYIYLMCVCLWFEGRKLGTSKTEIYLNLLELILERSTKKLEPNIDVIGETNSVTDKHKCFVERRYSKYHQELLSKVCKLAFDSLFIAENREAFVLTLEFTRDHLDSNELDKCLKLSLLSLTKSYASVAKRDSYVSFGHKSMLEFFAAFHMQCGDVDSKNNELKRTILTVCSSVSAMLEMSGVFVFMSGFNARKYWQISTDILTVVNENKDMCSYRRALFFGHICFDIISRIQKLQVDCVREIEMSGQKIPPLSVHDILVNKDTSSTETESLLQLLAQNNIENVKSFSIDECENAEVSQLLNMFYQNAPTSLEMVRLYCVFKEPGLQQLLRHSLQSLGVVKLHYMHYNQHKHIWHKTEISSDSLSLIFSMPLLQVLDLTAFILKHDQLQCVADFVSSRRIITGIVLETILCKNHKDSCSGVSLHLDQHENLQHLCLIRVPVSHLKLNPRHLEKCLIGKLPNCVTAYWLRSLPETRESLSLLCKYFTDDMLSCLIDIVPKLTQLELIDFQNLSFGDRVLVLNTDMKNLRRIHFSDVKLSSKSLRDLIESVSKLSQPVVVGLFDCSVTPEEMFHALKKEIRHSDLFCHIYDGCNTRGEQEFSFCINC